MIRFASLLALCALFAGCATTGVPAHNPPHFALNKFGIPYVGKDLSHEEGLVILHPERACTGSSFGTLFYMNTRTGVKLSAVWSEGVPVPPSWNQELGVQGREMCRWYKAR